MSSIASAKIAQVGCGYWGKNLVRNFAQIGALVAICDEAPAVAARISAEFSVPAATWPEILDDPRINAVSLATPAEVHADMAIAALAAGKHVMVEKPLALNSCDAMRVVNAARVADKVVMVGHLLQYHPVFCHLRALVAEGFVGKLRYCYSNRMSLGKFRAEENVLWSFAPHDLSMLLALAAEEPDQVSCQGAAFVVPGLADWATLQMIFPSGLRGHVQVSWASAYKEQRLVIIGERGMLVFDDAEPDWAKKLIHYAHVIDRTGSVAVPIKADPQYIVVPHGEPLRQECLHFVTCVENGLVPRTDTDEALGVLRVLEKAESDLAESLRMARQST